MIKINEHPITQEDMDIIAIYMDDDTREAVHLDLAPCSPEEFLREYLERDPDFIITLEQEFGYEDA